MQTSPTPMFTIDCANNSLPILPVDTCVENIMKYNAIVITVRIPFAIPAIHHDWTNTAAVLGIQNKEKADL